MDPSLVAAAPWTAWRTRLRGLADARRLDAGSGAHLIALMLIVVAAFLTENRMFRMIAIVSFSGYWVP